MTVNFPHMGESDELRDLERDIFEAGDYVVPSENLRPKIMETVEEQVALRVKGKRMAIAASSALAVWLICLTLASTFDGLRDSIAGPFPDEIHRSVEAARSPGNVSPGEVSLPYERYRYEWGMVETYQDMRSVRSSGTSGPRRPAKRNPHSDGTRSLDSEDLGIID